MMLRRTLPLLILALSAFGAAQDDHSKPYWDQKYKEIAKMFGKKDMKAFGALLAPSFKCVEQDKSVLSKAQLLEQNRVIFQDVIASFGSFVVLGIKPARDTVVVNIDHYYRINYKVPRGTNNKRSNGEERATDTWKKIGGKWLLVKEVITYSNYVTFEVPYEIKHRGDVGGG